MSSLPEYDVRQEIDQIHQAGCSPMRKTRRYLDLSRRIRRSMLDLERSMERLDEGGAAEDAGSLSEQRRTLHLLDEDVRVRAVRTLRASRRRRLGFGYGPQVSQKSIWGSKGASRVD